MPVIAAEVVRRLASFRGEQAPVTTCYLDVDGRRYLRQQDLEREVSVLLKGARAKANGDSSVTRDLHRIEEYVKAGLRSFAHARPRDLLRARRTSCGRSLRCRYPCRAAS